MADDEDTSPEKDFADNTTLHGIGKVSGSEKCSLKLLWLAIFLACFGVATWQITETIIRYLQYNTVTNIKLEFENELVFPAVTVCNFNRFEENRLQADTQAYLSALLYGYYLPPPVGVYYDPVLNELVSVVRDDLDPVNTTLEAGWQLVKDWNFYVCEFKGEECTVADFEHVFTTYGNCYTFNAVVDPDNPRRQRLPGAGNGLKLIFNIQSEFYTEDPAQGGSDDVGMKVLIHDQKEPPKMDTQGIAVGPGSHAFIGISKVEYKNEIPPWGDCQDLELQYYKNYTLTGCLLECRTKHVYEQCGCRLFYLPGGNDYCEPEEIANCALDTINAVTAGNYTCDCPTPCDISHFQTSVSYAGWPNKNTARYWLTYLDLWDSWDEESATYYMSQNWVVLDIYYSELNYQVIEQQREMTEGDLLSNIGGQLGLFIGASVITLFEFVEYLTKRVTSCFRKKYMKDKVSDVNIKPEKSFA
ncbi:acid-sensing ion channel 5-like [Branchiostoma lanceolatum]|uniref:acid-sensing ion channel 5-like n=1 Tax=Branchiostoma lanceolatum TaxID=7740 RepID=UPI003455D6CE